MLNIYEPSDKELIPPKFHRDAKKKLLNQKTSSGGKEEATTSF